jgi:uncharacterized phage-associated protein
LYILDEYSIRKSGIPFLNISYKVWKFGPVPADIYIDLSSDLTLFNKYIKKICDRDHEYFVPIKEFSDDEFSDAEIELLDIIINLFKHHKAKDLIKHTHKVGAPWYNAAKNGKVLDLLLNQSINTTDFDVNLEELLVKDARKLKIYNDFKEHFNSLNS